MPEIILLFRRETQAFAFRDEEVSSLWALIGYDVMAPGFLEPATEHKEISSRLLFNRFSTCTSTTVISYRFTESPVGRQLNVYLKLKYHKQDKRVPLPVGKVFLLNF